jgi:3-methyladenine DNA glycosylase/8-oxoguanine DNA glycosylase
VLETSGNDLTLKVMLHVAVDDIEPGLQKPGGLSKANAVSIVDLANHFQDERLSEEWLNGASDKGNRRAMLKVTGIGPWSCDIFLIMFSAKTERATPGRLGRSQGVRCLVWMAWKSAQGPTVSEKRRCVDQ